MHRHTAFIFNGFLLLEMPQCTWSARLDGNQRTEGGGWEIGKGGERVNNFTRASMVCSHFVIDFLKRKGEKNASATILRYFPLNPHNLLLSGRAVRFVSVKVYVCAPARVFQCVCGQKSKSVPGQQSRLKTQPLIL